ncbi:MAG: nucleotidyl transferase AbiEii/AbiGii toxin family protein, partial [Candidatus Micrarchaeia archaeon]
VRKAFENRKIHGITFLKVKSIEREKKGNTALAVQYSSKVSGAGHVDSIRTEFSAETPVLLKAQDRKISDPLEYNLPKTTMQCMALEEILTEKVHAIYHRRKPRDLYDLSYLLDKRTPVNHGMIAEKLKPLNISLEIETFRERTQMLGERWDYDLGKLFVKVPDFRKAQEKALKGLFG